MLDKYKNLLSQSYEQYQSTGNREIKYDFSGITEKQAFYDCYDYLKECGYVETIAPAMGFFIYKLTPYGISFVENGYTESNNYNQISAEIENSNLPDDYKQLIEALLYDIRNPHVSTCKKTERIKSFLSDISSGALSDAATSGLTALLSTLFNKISF